MSCILSFLCLFLETFSYLCLTFLYACFAITHCIMYLKNIYLPHFYKTKIIAAFFLQYLYLMLLICSLLFGCECCRHSPAGSGYPNSGLLRQSADTSGRSAPRPQPYPLYQGPGPSAQSQVHLYNGGLH